MKILNPDLKLNKKFERRISASGAPRFLPLDVDQSPTFPERSPQMADRGHQQRVQTHL